MEIKATCKYDIEVMKDLTKFTLFKTINPNKSIIIYNIIYILFNIPSIYSAIQNNRFTPLINSLILTILINIIFIFNLYIMPKINASKQDAFNEYVFNDDTFAIITNKQSKLYTFIFNYHELNHVYETNKYLLLFNGKKVCFVVEKNSIINGTLNELKDKLKQNIKGKYKICDY